MTTLEVPAEAAPFLISLGTVGYAVLISFLMNRSINRDHPKPQTSSEAFTPLAMSRFADWASDVQLLGATVVAWGFAIAEGFAQDVASWFAVALGLGAVAAMGLIMTTSPFSYGRTFRVLSKVPITYGALVVGLVNLFALEKLWWKAIL